MIAAAEAQLAAASPTDGAGAQGPLWVESGLVVRSAMVGKRSYG